MPHPKFEYCRIERFSTVEEPLLKDGKNWLSLSIAPYALESTNVGGMGQVSGIEIIGVMGGVAKCLECDFSLSEVREEPPLCNQTPNKT